MNILITAGGTREYIDPVRFITNASSGKMGYAIAQECIRAGHSVILISAPVSITPPFNIKPIAVTTADDMLKAVKKHFKKCDCLIMAAAVSDYTPQETSPTKLKKKSKKILLKLKPTVDILQWAGDNKRHQILVGFALEDKKIFEMAEKKLTQKNLDMIIANSPAAIGSDKSQLFIKGRISNWQKLKSASKLQNAKKIVKLIEQI